MTQEQEYKIEKAHLLSLIEQGYPIDDDEFLCLFDDGRFGYYGKNMKAYPSAIEKTPSVLPKKCETCGQEIKIPEDTTLEDIEEKVEAYRNKLISKL